jgi:hypothetical protein
MSEHRVNYYKSSIVFIALIQQPLVDRNTVYMLQCLHNGEFQVNDENLKSEIEAKRQELGADVPLTGVLEALMRDAAETWELLLLERVPHRNSLLMDLPNDDLKIPGREFQTVSSFERVMAKSSNPKLRRFCTVAARLPPLIRPVAKTGVGADEKLCWLLIWLDASGMTAPSIAEELRPQLRPHRPPKRDRIWKLRKKIYEQLATTLAPSNADCLGLQQ